MHELDFFTIPFHSGLSKSGHLFLKREGYYFTFTNTLRDRDKLSLQEKKNHWQKLVIKCLSSQSCMYSAQYYNRKGDLEEILLNASPESLLSPTSLCPQSLLKPTSPPKFQSLGIGTGENMPSPSIAILTTETGYYFKRYLFFPALPQQSPLFLHNWNMEET